MTTYYGATALVRPYALIGQGAYDDDDIVTHHRHATAELMEASVNRRLAEITANHNIHYILGMHLAGSGDGSSFVTMVLSGQDASVGVLGLPEDTTHVGSKAFFYMAATEAELPAHLAAARARITAWLVEGPGYDGEYITEQCAGSAQGAPFMGLLLVQRFSQT